MIVSRTYLVKISVILLFLISIVATVHAQNVLGATDPSIRSMRVRYLSEAIEPSGNLQRAYLVLDERGVIDGSD